MNMIRSIEELSFNAWPALQMLHYDGWILRFAESYTRRANSVNAIYPSTLPTLEKIRYCGQVYAAHGLDTVFKISPIMQPDNLDAILESSGYRQEARTSVRIAALIDQSLSVDSTAKSDSKLTDDWLNTYIRLIDPNPRHLPVMKRLLENILPMTCYMSVRDGGEPVAMGLAVLERGYIGLFDIVTAASHRNRGFGIRLIAQLLAWGQANGAEHAYLQVMVDNTPAVSLYDKFGFKEIYQYWYRVKARS